MNGPSTILQPTGLERGLGRGDRAAAHLKRALSPVPDYHYALAAREARTSHDVAGQDPEDLHAGADSAGE
jgi:hypothetical protein